MDWPHGEGSTRHVELGFRYIVEIVTLQTTSGYYQIVMLYSEIKTAFVLSDQVGSILGGSDDSDIT